MKNTLNDIRIGVMLCVFCMSIGGHAAAAELAEIRMGKHSGFSRIVFEFKDAVQYRLESDHEPGRVSITFDGATSNIPAPVIKESSLCIDDLSIFQQESGLSVRIAVAADRFRLNPFVIESPFRMVLDITCLEEAEAAPAPPPPEAGSILPDEPQAVVFSYSPAENPEFDSPAEKALPAPADIRPRPPEKPPAFQNYLIAILAVLSLIILGLAGIILFRYRAAAEKSSRVGIAKTLKHSEEMLSSIDAEIRQKLQTHGEP